MWYNRENEVNAAAEGRTMISLLEYLQNVQRHRYCADGCDPCPFCGNSGRVPHFCPIDGHMLPYAKHYAKEYVIESVGENSSHEDGTDERRG